MSFIFRNPYGILPSPIRENARLAMQRVFLGVGARCAFGTNIALYQSVQSIEGDMAAAGQKLELALIRRVVGNVRAIYWSPLMDEHRSAEDDRQRVESLRSTGTPLVRLP